MFEKEYFWPFPFSDKEVDRYFPNALRAIFAVYGICGGKKKRLYITAG
jgi:hypothetical protein